MLSSVPLSWPMRWSDGSEMPSGNLTANSPPYVNPALIASFFSEAGPLRSPLNPYAPRREREFSLLGFKRVEGSLSSFCCFVDLDLRSLSLSLFSSISCFSYYLFVCLISDEVSSWWVSRFFVSINARPCTFRIRATKIHRFSFLFS